MDFVVATVWSFLHLYWQWVAIGLLYLLGAVAAVHVLLTKRDPRAAFGWVVACLGVPGVGVLVYLLFGINRIRTRARQFHALTPVHHSLPQLKQDILDFLLTRGFPFDPHVFHSLLMISNAVTQRPLVGRCTVLPFYDGDGVYPEMLAAIAAARDYIYLSTYIFDRDQTGTAFAHALKAAQERGVDVRVLIDGVGNLYSFPTLYGLLKKLRVRAALFLPFSFSRRTLYFNLRNHRKILVVDGQVGFTGGINISDRHLTCHTDNPRRVHDIHFKVNGPILSQMRAAFLADWRFATGEPEHPAVAVRLELASVSETVSVTAGEYDDILYHLHHMSVPAAGSDRSVWLQAGHALCRGIVAGPNEDREKLRWIVLGAFAAATRKVRIMTPYFIPDAAMASAINTAVLRGVTVEIILPQTNNLPYVDWACRALLWELLQYDVHIYYQPGAFVHSKFLIVDDFFSLVGSANLDPRSLRLNFEFNLEVYDLFLAQHLSAHFDGVKARSRRLHLDDVDKRPLPIKLRDAVAKLFSPYL